MRDDEKLLLRTILTSKEEMPYVRDIVEHLGIPEKRAEYILNKWISKGWYECGISLFAGWLIESKKEFLKKECGL